jgi:tRNA/rRNA methyltransferase
MPAYLAPGRQEGGMAGPVVVLVRPQMGENIGAAARAMLNFGLSELRIVDPRDGWPNPKAVAMASGAGRVLDAARLCPDVPSALTGLGLVFATTARAREMTKTVFSPAAAMERAAGAIAAGMRVGLMFGPERSGLTNEDLLLAQGLVSVPVNPDFPSLNIAQCVLLTAYEWQRATGVAQGEALVIPGGRLAERNEVAVLSDAMVGRLEGQGFFRPEAKRPAMEATIRNMLGRLPLTDADVRTLWGIMRALSGERLAQGEAGGEA